MYLVLCIQKKKSATKYGISSAKLMANLIFCSFVGESKSESSPEPEEMYDDVNTSISAASTKQKSCMLKI